MEWISVEDRLPEPFQWVLVYGSKGRYAFGNVQSWQNWKVPHFIGEVTHWMPLPDPPQENIGDWAACATKEGSTVNITIKFSPNEKITVEKLMALSEKVIGEAFVNA